MRWRDCYIVKKRAIHDFQEAAVPSYLLLGEINSGNEGTPHSGVIFLAHVDLVDLKWQVFFATLVTL